MYKTLRASYSAIRSFYGLQGHQTQELPRAAHTLRHWSKRSEADPLQQGLLITTKSCIAFYQKLQRLPSLSYVCLHSFHSKFSESMFLNAVSVAIPQIVC